MLFYIGKMHHRAKQSYKLCILSLFPLCVLAVFWVVFFNMWSENFMVMYIGFKLFYSVEQTANIFVKCTQNSQKLRYEMLLKCVYYLYFSTPFLKIAKSTMQDTIL